MTKLPRPSGKEMISFLVKEGFTVKRITGSHHFLEREHEHTCVPVHGNDSLKIGTLRSILRDIDMSPAEFEQAWHR